MARLDVPTWDDPVVSAQIEAVLPKGSNTVAWAAITSLVQTGSTILRLFSQSAVLMGVLRDQRDGYLLSLLSMASEAFAIFNLSYGGDLGGSKEYRLLVYLLLSIFPSLGCYHAQQRFRQDGGT